MPFEPTAIDDIASLPDNFITLENYPNPFNAQTTINYNISQPADVIVEIFDILGRKVETLVNSRRTAGNHAITWQADGVPSGVYFYKLTAGKIELTKRMVLLK